MRRNTSVVAASRDLGLVAKIIVEVCEEKVDLIWKLNFEQ